MAEGEFAQVKDRLQVGIAIHDILSRKKVDYYAMLTDVAVLERNEAGLRHYTPLLEELALRDNHTLYLAIAHRAWGVLFRLTGEYEQAQSRLDQALNLFQRIETRWQIGRTFSELAELRLARGEPAEAKKYYSQALASFEQIGARPDIKRTRQAMDPLSPFSPTS